MLQERFLAVWIHLFPIKDHLSSGSADYSVQIRALFDVLSLADFLAEKAHKNEGFGIG
jgi:hypothetical protein